jgi:hypothetical protein
MNGLARRVAELEKASPSIEPAEIWPLIAIRAGEMEEKALARYMAEHPGEPEPANWIALIALLPNIERTHDRQRLAASYRTA